MDVCCFGWYKHKNYSHPTVCKPRVLQEKRAGPCKTDCQRRSKKAHDYAPMRSQGERDARSIGKY
ncbi:hypothetical protein E2562_015774 [Oryza meyeriana var. granulata]|uniref:Uncharacterized protein n=1 Tax=Oryza meyeriana var. granulata TaxID=110450 RepID=A0A6G1D4P0_9ORYZ|nr:hypothetical protein E2562_015774 [Oryza meyeriana var. granulata]